MTGNVNLDASPFPRQDVLALATFGTATGLGLALLWFLFSTIRQWYRLRHIPGPPLASVSAAWLIRCLASGRFHEHMIDVAEKYGMYLLPGSEAFGCVRCSCVMRADILNPEPHLLLDSFIPTKLSQPKNNG